MRGPNHSTPLNATPLTPDGEILKFSMPSITIKEKDLGALALVLAMPSAGKPTKPVTRLTAIKDAKSISNEAELTNRKVVIVKKPCVGLQGKIVKVVTAERINEAPRTKGHRDVFYTVETDERYITGLTWQDILQLPRP